jgi:hypothetical protein
MFTNEPRASFACVWHAALPVVAPIVTLGVMLSLLAFVWGEMLPDTGHPFTLRTVIGDLAHLGCRISPWRVNSR